MCEMKRMWIDQPSTLQTFHDLHGVNVLCCPSKEDTVRVYFLEGKIISQLIWRNALAPGWKSPNQIQVRYE